jgi:hypothetical protein
VGATLRTIAWIVTIVGCLVALWMSIWPGELVDVLFVVVLLFFGLFWVWFPLLVIAGAVTAYLYWDNGIPDWRRWLVHLALMAAVCCFSLGLIVLRVPLRIAFAISQSAFEQQLAVALVQEDVVTDLNKRLGAYLVDQHAKDSRGGIYYRVHWGGVGIGPEVMSYGFAYLPNAVGTPFGAAHYSTTRLTGDWYLFRASDDWF